jgi:hypothetical protein
MSDDYVQVPVPARWVHHVYARLAELAAAEAGDSVPSAQAKPPEKPELDKALVRRMYKESQAPHRKLMLYLANHPDRWFYTPDLASHLRIEKGSRGLAGMLGAFGRRSKNRYGGQTPWETDWDQDKHEARHRMRGEVADWIKTFRDDPDLPSPVWE